MTEKTYEAHVKFTADQEGVIHLIAANEEDARVLIIERLNDVVQNLEIIGISEYIEIPSDATSN